MNESPLTLAGILHPLPASDFLSRYYGNNFLYGPGRAGRFTSLLPWTSLNDILRTHRLDTPRLRLVREGKSLSADTYTNYQTARKPAQSRIPRLRAPEITRQLRDGATLVLDAVDELHPPITELAQNLEFALRCRIQVNMYAGWRRSRGFDLHYDEHDVIVLQVSGRKEWKVYPVTHEHPLPGDSHTKHQRPEKPVWEGMLNEGDMLYLPRGWWHVAIPLDEPTLHVTVGLHKKTGADFLSWLAERMQQEAAVRRDLPLFASATERAEYLEALRASWNAAFDPALLEEYLGELDARVEPRPSFGFPFTATPEVLPPHDAWSLQWIVPRPTLASAPDNETIRVSCRRKEYVFSAAAQPLLSLLATRKPCTFQELCSAGLPAETVRSLATDLLNAGLVALTADVRGL